MAKMACGIVSRIREEESRTVWTSEYEDSLAKSGDVDVYPGMMFSLAKERMEKTKLWAIVRKMPKGALLHAHMDAMVDVDWLLEKALATEGMHLRASEPLCSPAALETASITFCFAKAAPRTDQNIWSEQYESETLVPLTAAVEAFPNGGRPAFKAWFKDRCTITPHESVSHHQGPNAIWRKFQSTFPILGSILFYEPIFRASIQRVLGELLEDGVRWVEFRLAFHFGYRREGCDEPEDGYEECIRVFGEEVQKFQGTETGQGFWGARSVQSNAHRSFRIHEEKRKKERNKLTTSPRMIYTTLRKLPKRSIITSMKQCIAAKKAHPHLISGYDLVGQEDLGRPLSSLTPELFWFRKACVEAGVEIPFFLHAGECLGTGDATDSNLFDAILLGTRRIGHGFSLYKHPVLIDMVRDKRILVESCPVSNEILRLTSSVMAHPLPALLARGVAVALCNDDPAILGHGKCGLTHDYWQAVQGWENLGLEGLGSLAENSVRWAAFVDQRGGEFGEDVRQGAFGGGLRAERMREWAGEFERFCAWVVGEFGVEYGSEGED